jgi:hypothetical protein
VVDLANPADTPSSVPLTLCIYVDNFIYFSEDSAVEEKFQHLLTDLITVDFMGMVEWFLVKHFQWLLTPDKVEVHLSQTRFASHLVKENSVHLRNIIARAFQSTQYQSLTKMKIHPCSKSTNTNTKVL